MFEEAREHLGVETQRQWSDKAIARCTPVLMGLYSLVFLMGNRLGQAELLKVEQTAWYQKEHATFSDRHVEGGADDDLAGKFNSGEGRKQLFPGKYHARNGGMGRGHSEAGASGRLS